MLRTVLIWCAGLAVAAFTGSYALGMVATNTNPLLAMSTAPTNGFAYANGADALLKAAVLQGNGQVPDKFDPQVKQWAETAYRHEPMAYVAPRMLAMDFAARGDLDRARKLMRLVPELSKRDRIANFWLVEDYGRLGDVEAILKYYDLTLRTSRPAGELLIPMMAKALANTEFVGPFEGLLAEAPPWADPFWQRLVRTQGSLVNAALLRERLKVRKIRVDPEHDRTLSRQLVQYGHFESARRLGKALTGSDDIDRVGLTNGDFDRTPLLPPFDWDMSAEGEYGAAIDSKSGTMLVSAIPGTQGVAARQLVRLQPGKYRVTRSFARPPEKSTRLTAKLRCAERPASVNLLDTAELNRADDPGEWNLSSTQCRNFWFEIEIAIDSKDAPDDVYFDRIGLQAI